MTKPTKKQLEKRLSALHAGSPSAEVVAFVDKCHAWLETNKDNRGTTAEAIKDGFYCAIRLEQALRVRSHDDSSIRRLAEKTVTAMLHKSFPEIRECLRTLNGRVSKVGRRRADKRRQDAARAIELSQQFELRELRSVTSLQSVGRTLRNCVAKRSYARDYLRDPDTEMWTLYELAQQRPLYLLRVDRSAKEICEIEGHDSSSPQLERPLAFKVLKALDVSADDDEAFARVGAFRAFLDGQPAVESVEADGCIHWIWVLRGTEIIIATKTQTGKHWSRFLRRDAETGNHRRRQCERGFVAGDWNHLSESELLELIVDHPLFAEMLHSGVLEKRLERNMLPDLTELW